MPQGSTVQSATLVGLSSSFVYLSECPGASPAGRRPSVLVRLLRGLDPAARNHAPPCLAQAVGPYSGTSCALFRC